MRPPGTRATTNGRLSFPKPDLELPLTKELPAHLDSEPATPADHMVTVEGILQYTIIPALRMPKSFSSRLKRLPNIGSAARRNGLAR